MYRHLEIDTDKNMLVCSLTLVGRGELVEVHQGDDGTPPQAMGKILKKVSETDFEVYQTFDGHEAMGRRYRAGSKCLFRVLLRNLSGIRRRRFSSEEAPIINIEKDDNYKERKVSRAKTGSVRKRRPKPRKKQRTG